MTQDTSTIPYAAEAPEPILPWRRFHHWLTVIALALSDVAVFAIAYILFRIGHQVPALMLFWGGQAGGPAIDAYLVLVSIFIVVRYLAGDYTKRVPFWDLTRRSTAALLIIAALDILFMALMQQAGAWIATIFMWSIILPAIPLARQSTKRLLSAVGLWQIPTILITSGEHIDEVLGALSSSIGLGFSVRHVVLTDDVAAPPAVSNFLHLEDPATISRVAAKTGCGQVVLAMEDLVRMSEIMQRLIGMDMNVTVIPPFRRLPLFGMSANLFFGRDILLLQVRNNLSRVPSRFIKRAFDIVGSSLLLLVLAPVLIVLGILIKRDDPSGPAIFVQSRIGRRGREFPCLKFRTMKVDAELILTSWETEQPHLIEQYRASNFKLADDPRVTNIGRWLRSTSLDELPQLANVLMGDMSLIGPRPLLAREISDYGSAIELYQKVRPGISGLWQINGRSDTTFQDRVTYDEWYIKNWSLWYDVVIMLRTLRVVFGRNRGAY